LVQGCSTLSEGEEHDGELLADLRLAEVEAEDGALPHGLAVALLHADDDHLHIVRDSAPRHDLKPALTRELILEVYLPRYSILQHSSTLNASQSHLADTGKFPG
jgi:hypothetical protein